MDTINITKVISLDSIECSACGRFYDVNDEIDMEQYSNHGEYCDETREG